MFCFCPCQAPTLDNKAATPRSSIAASLISHYTQNYRLMSDREMQMINLLKRLGVVPLVVLILAVLACNAPTRAKVSARETQTAIAQATAGTPVGEVTQQTSTPPGTPATSILTWTPAPQQCIATADDVVNVRGGPSTYHPILRVLSQNTTGVVTGRNADSSWWQIDGNGWVSASFVTTSGPCGSIAEASFPPAPPTATPPPITPGMIATSSGLSFKVSYVKTWKCGKKTYVTISVANTGSEPLRSLGWRVDSPPGTKIASDAQNAPFRNKDQEKPPRCSAPGGASQPPGTNGYVYLNLGEKTFASGTAATAALTFCTENGLGGECDIKIVTFNF